MRKNVTHDENWFDWHGQEDARRRVVSFLAVLAGAEREQVLELGRTARSAEGPALGEARLRARQTFYGLAEIPAIGEEMAALAVRERIGELERSGSAGEPVRPAQESAPTINPDSGRDLWSWACRGAQDTLTALILADEISMADFKRLTRAWRRTIGDLAAG